MSITSDDEFFSRTSKEFSMGFHKKLNHIVEVGRLVFKVVPKFNPLDPPFPTPTLSPPHPTPPSAPLLSMVCPASWSTECKIEAIHQPIM